MTKTFTTAKSIESSSLIDKPGTFHCTVLHSAEDETTRGKVMNNRGVGGASAILSVLDGTVDGQEGKEFHLHLFDPDISKDGWEDGWNVKKMTAYAISVNQLDPAKLGEESSMKLGGLDGQQLVISLDFKNVVKKDDDGNEVIENGKKVWVKGKDLALSFANIYHVDDPRAANFPKDKEALALLPKEFRKTVEYFDAISGKAKTAPAMKPKGISDDDLNDL